MTATQFNENAIVVRSLKESYFAGIEHAEDDYDMQVIDAIDLVLRDFYLTEEERKDWDIEKHQKVGFNQ